MNAKAKLECVGFLGEKARVEKRKEVKNRSQARKKRVGWHWVVGRLSKWLFYIACVQLKWKVTPDK